MEIDPNNNPNHEDANNSNKERDDYQFNKDRDDYQFMVSASMLAHDVDVYRKWQQENMETSTKEQSLSGLRRVVRFLNLISGDISCTMDLISLTESNNWFPTTKVDRRMEFHGVENLLELKELSWQIEARRKIVLTEIASREQKILKNKQKVFHAVDQVVKKPKLV